MTSTEPTAGAAAGEPAATRLAGAPPSAGAVAIPPLLVLAVGNPSRGDDALGPALLEALQAEGAADDGEVELITDFQLQVEHALDLQGRRAVLFVDAARPGAVPDAAGVRLAPVQAAVVLPALSHALTPEGVLHVLARLGGPLPPAWQLAIEGESFSLGEPPGAVAQARLGQALELARAWIASQRPCAPVCAPA